MLRLDGDRPVRLQTQGAGNVVRIEGDRPVQFQNSTFHNVAGNMNVSHTTNVGESGLDILLRAVSLDAMHDSAERPADPACHPGTRSAILEELDKWSFEQPSDSPILWLHGCAGIGKSAIAQQFAASCHGRGQLGGSFFFKRGSVSRGTWRNLLPTLAYQLTVAFPQLGPRIQRAVEMDRLVLGKTIHHQLEKLLVQPFRNAPPLTSRPILVIDGLDECEDHRAQIALIRALIDTLRSGDAPIHILVCSRSEAHLCEAFKAPENSDVCRDLQVLPDDRALADIRRYFTDEFSRIHGIHTSRGILLEVGWPGRDTIEDLVKKSSGTFIYASTVLRYVDNEYSHPAERLDAVLGLDPGSLSPLDDLYTQILSTLPNKPTLLRVLSAVVEGDLDPEQIDVVLRMRRGTSRAILRGLHSVVRVHPARVLWYHKPVALLHASFGDFLMDSQRSLSFCISGEDLLDTLVHDMAHVLLSGSLGPEDFWRIAIPFVECLPKVPPTDGLLPVFWTVDFQHDVYRQGKDYAQVVVTWLQDADSTRDLPSELIYPQYLQSPDLLSVLRIWNVLNRLPESDGGSEDIIATLDLLALKWDVLVPLTKVSGTDLVDIKAIQKFLDDPDKCGQLFMPHKEICRFTALQWIRCLKDTITQTNFTGDQFYMQHKYGPVQPKWFAAILDWIKKAPSPPPDLIRSWEQQQKAVEQCYACLLEMNPDSDTSDSGSEIFDSDDD
ncbi:hypothetical protein FB45DRAFT_873989 [Roridomyces roridus]|uniref:Nephrocystin 3-like N-terminal domain-containing protein n=1 Tax=Roridomyces roridus TaxID=1738132 RepID=A0AAD7B9Y7_9AGAR|nr:hypothetical protein FB45DRAFT_873989 [Roridomyces roridus]